MTKSQLLSKSLLSQLNGLQPSITTMTSTKTTATMKRMTMTTSKTPNGSNNDNDNNDNDDQNSKNKILLVHSRKIRNQLVAERVSIDFAPFLISIVFVPIMAIKIRFYSS